MKKNFKVLSSLALAGMLTTSVLGTSLAATKDVTSVTPGVCSKFIAGTKNIVPFVLANNNDIITIKDIKESGKFGNITKFNGAAVSSEDTQIRTGNTFTSNGKEYTVVIFGDADKNGDVNVLDALEIAKHLKGLDNKITGDVMATELANVIRADKSDVNILDALRIVKFVRGQEGQENNLVDELPEADAVEEYSYILTVNDGYINNQNANATTIKIGLEPSEENITGLTLKVLDAKEQDISTTISASLSTSFTINKNLNLHEISGLDFSNVNDGTYTIQLIKDNKVVGETAVEKNTKAPTAAKVKVNRLNTKEATLSLEGYGTEIKKVYYVLGPVDDSTAISSMTIDDNTKYISVNGNKVVNAKIDEELSNAHYYVLAYVLENAVGSRSSVLNTTIPLDGNNVEQQKVVTNIVVPTLNSNTEKQFSWTKDSQTAADATYTVTLYKDNEIVYVDNNVSSTQIDFTNVGAGSENKMKEAGKYKVGVVVNGTLDGTKTASEEVVSGEVEIRALQEVSKIEFTIPETGNARKISWTDANSKDDVANYTIKLYKFNTATQKYVQEGSDITTNATETKEKEIDISSKGFVTNELFKAEIIVNAKGNQNAIMESKAKSLEGFYEVAINSASLIKATDNSVTIKPSGDKVSGYVPNYKVEVYEAVTETEGLLQPVTKYVYMTTKDVTLTENGEIVVNGLEKNKDYSFILVADVNGIQGKSGKIRAVTSPTINSLKRVAKVEEATVANTIYSDLANNKVYIDGKEITNINLYDNSLKEALKVVEKIHVNDVITISEDTITVVLEDSKASSDTTDTIDFASTAVGKKLVLTGKAKNQRTIAADANAGNTKKQPAEVMLQGNEAMFETTGLNADNIILTNGVEIIDTTANKEFTIAANSTVTINGITVKTDKKTIMVVNGTTLNVKLEQGTTTNNNLTFTNSKGKTAVIGFVQINSGNPATYMGTITINSTGGSVKVNTERSVNASNVTLNVIAKDATVDVSDASQAGNTNITTTVTKDDSNGTNETKFVPQKDIPSYIAGQTIELKEYTDAELVVAIPAISGDEEAIKEVREFINSFKLNGTGAKVSYTAGDSFVKINFTKAGTYTIQGIK